MALLYEINRDRRDAALPEFLFENTTDFSGCLSLALQRGGFPTGFLEKLFEKTTNFSGCLYWALIGEGYSQYFLERLAEKTTDFSGCLYMTLARGGHPQEFLERLFEKTTSFRGCLHAGFPPGEFMDKLLEGGVKPIMEGPYHGYEKYYVPLIVNKECFICLLDFEDDPGAPVERVPCGHKVHKGCNTQKFRCPYR